MGNVDDSHLAKAYRLQFNFDIIAVRRAFIPLPLEAMSCGTVTSSALAF